MSKQYKTEGNVPDKVAHFFGAIVTGGASLIGTAIDAKSWTEEYKTTVKDDFGNEAVGFGKTSTESKANADAALDAQRGGIQRTRES